MSAPARHRARRVAATAYGSPLFQRAWRAAERCAPITGPGWRAMARRLAAGRPLTWLYALILPRLTIVTSASPGGRAIRAQFAFWEDKWRGQHVAQGVLVLPDRFEDYLRGRHRQAVRTNVRAARRAGVTVTMEIDANWLPGTDDDRRPLFAPTRVECYVARDVDGQVVGQAILSVDSDAALLHGLLAHRGATRWLLHTAIVERLCGSCSVLLTNSHHALRISPGAQHFQRLLGYEIVRLRRPRSLLSTLADERVGLGLLCLLAGGLMTGAHALHPVVGDEAVRTFLWLTPLVAARRLSNRAGVAAGTACVAAALIVAQGGAWVDAVAVRDAVTGLVIDGLFAVIPRLTWGPLAAAPAGAIALVVPELLVRGSGFHHHQAALTALIAAAVAGGCAAGCGWALGQWLEHLPRLQLSGPFGRRNARQLT